MNKNHCLRRTRIALGAALLAAIAQTAAAATLCVNSGGTKGCFATIGAAVAAASPNDTISVSAGTYKEDVVIGKPLSLIGANRNNTIIDATGLANGVYIDGLDNPGLSKVVVTGFTAQNANFEGILVTNASFVTVWGNTVTDNDRNLEPSIPACPGIPDFETGEALDCGEGIHLLGVDHSTVASNTVENNSGGILLSDDTGQTRDNLVTGNLVKDNPFDCGIVMASHAPGPGSTAPHLGVVRNTIADNESTHKGFRFQGRVQESAFLPTAAESDSSPATWLSTTNSPTMVSRVWPSTATLARRWTCLPTISTTILLSLTRFPATVRIFSTPRRRVPQGLTLTAVPEARPLPVPSSRRT